MYTEIIAKWLARPLKAFSSADIPELAASVGTTVGFVRPDNQDRAVIARFTSAHRPRECFVCFALCDGMGGMADGSRCAEIALSSFIARLTHDIRGTTSEDVRTAALAANAEVFRQFRERGGTTLVAMVVFPASAAAVSVGDSRIYAATSQNGLKQISIDDTIAGELNKLRGLNVSRSGWASFAGQLTQFVGIGEGMEPRVYPINTDLTHLLTSDGVHNIDPDTLKRIVSFGRTSQPIVSRLLQVARWCGGIDNATAICVSPLRKDWSVPPASGGDDWLEIWDAGGKLELPLRQFQALSPDSRGTLKKNDRLVSKTKRSKKRSAPIKAESGPHLPAQGNLKIEILDEKPHHPVPEINQPSESASKENSSTDDPGGKRE